MGLGSNGKKVLYRLENLTIQEVAIAAARLYHEAADGSDDANGGNNNAGRPIIFVDANNVINKVGRKSVNPVARTAQFLKDISAEGLILSPVCDGDKRPQSKQQTNKNHAQRVKNQHNAVIFRKDLQKVSLQLKEEGTDEAARTTLVNQHSKLSKSIKTAETSSTNVVPPNFAEQLEEQLAKISAHNVQQGGGSVRHVMTAKFEADALIKGECMKFNFQMVMSEDADYAADLGDRCVSIGNFGSRNDIFLICTSKSLLVNALAALNNDTKAKLAQPDYPLYEGIHLPKLRLLISVILGCDVHPGGLGGIGPAKLYQKMNGLKETSGIVDEEELYNSLIDYATIESKGSAINKDVLETLVKGIMYQPTNERGCNDSEHTYVFDRPQKLPKYLAEFKTDSTILEDGPDVLQCKGPRHNCSHSCLAVVDHYNCKRCEDIVCRLCSTTLTSEKTDKDQYCLDCYLMEKLLPDNEGEDGGTDLNIKTIAEMRRELLTRHNFSGADKLSVEEVEEAWLGYELQRELEKMAESVRFPVYAASALEKVDNWEVLLQFSFTEGATFLNAPELDEEVIPDVIELLAAFVQFSASGKKQTNWQKDGAVYSAIPQMFIDFARQCRLDVCYRLLRRCLRHAFDGRTEALDASNNAAKLIRHNGKIGIHLSAPIAASMKKDIYDGETVFTKDEILCAKCDCKSGAQGNERNVCVHTMPRGLLLSILLAEDLAEHTLLELTSMLSSIAVETDVWDTQQIEKMKKSMITLMEASGELLVAREAAQKTTMFDMLQHYKTGTQSEKKWNRVNQRPKQNEIGPFESVVLDSPEQQAKELFNRSAPKPNLDPTEDELPLFTVDYVQIGLALNAIGFKPSESDAIGYKLLQWRRNKQGCDQDILLQQAHEAKSKWADLRKEAETRSIRQSEQQRENLKRQHDDKYPLVRRETYELRSQAVITPPPAKRKKSGRSGGNGCAKVGCNNNRNMEGIEFNRVPPYPKDLPAGATVARKLTHVSKRELRRELTDRLGLGRDDRTKELRVCDCHPIETIQRRLYVYDDNGSKVSKNYNITLIAGAGTQSSSNPSTASKGVGRNRMMHREIQKLLDDEERAKQLSPQTLPSDSARIDTEVLLRGELATTKLEIQRLAEESCRLNSPVTCPVIEMKAGLVRGKDSKSHLAPNQKKRFRVEEVPNSFLRVGEERSKSKGKKELSSMKPPKVLPTMPQSEVQRRTGFKNASALLAYVIVICNGNFDRMRERRTSLSWFEEWFIYLEFKYHHTNVRQQDMEAVWGIDKNYINRIKDAKSAIEMSAFRSWPRFASFEEDKELRNPQKWARYDSSRIIQWDMTNAPAQSFSDPSLYRATYSQYYGECCAKVGVGMQLCGWVTGERAWTGGVDDGTYHAKAGYMEAQKQFQEADLVDGKIKKFNNVLDRGYRNNETTLRMDQLSLQPPSAKSDRRFKGNETIYAGTVARDRSGNERGVRVMKRSGLFQHGFKAGMSAKRFCDALLLWGFQANFMYRPVH